MLSNLSTNVHDELDSVRNNRTTIPLLVAQVQRPLGVIPFVGAGLSIPLGFPSWRRFLEDQGRKWNILEQIERRLDAGEYEEAANDLLVTQEALSFHDEIDATFASDKVRGGLSRGAVSVLPRLATGPVITTNFDRVLEKTFEQAGKPFQRVVLGAKAEPAIQAYHQDRRFLLKIHGDVEESADRILTKDDYETYYGSADGTTVNINLPLPSLLRLMFLARPLLFVGCSLNQDRSVAVLEAVVREYPSIRHFAIVECPGTEEQFFERSRFLYRHKIRPIWYPHGRHELIEVVLNYLVNHIQRDQLDLNKKLHMSLDVEKSGLDIRLTGSNKSWLKVDDLKYRETPDGYLLTGFEEEKVGSEFKHFVVCDDTDEEKESVKDVLGKAGYIVTGDGKKDNEPDKWQIWFLVQDYPILRENNVWYGRPKEG